MSELSGQLSAPENTSGSFRIIPDNGENPPLPDRIIFSDKSISGCPAPLKGPGPGKPDSVASSAIRMRSKRERERNGLALVKEFIPHILVEGLHNLAEHWECTKADVIAGLIDYALKKNLPPPVTRHVWGPSLLTK